MDDSDQDFEDLSPKVLRRVRKKPGEPRQARKAGRQTSSQAGEEDKRRRNNKKAVKSVKKLSWSQPAAGFGDGGERCLLTEVAGHESGDAGQFAEPLKAAEPSPLRAKDKVLLRMQQFKRESPQKMIHKTHIQPVNHENSCAQQNNQDTPDSFSSAPPPEPQDSDEALALQLQQELDREAAQVQIVDLADGGLFFCQICHRDLTHMTPEGRTQHLNRCLDESEKSGPAPPPPPPPPPSGVPDCPICGKKFKSQMSRSVHLKRCSSDMGISPAVLVQALQRQAEENQSATTANLLIQAVGTKRKGPSKPGLPARKKSRKKPEPLDEETMVALALSSSLLEQEKEAERQYQTETAALHTSVTQELKWRPDAGKGRRKGKKGVVARPPPLLLIQGAEGALRRLQERVSALLLRNPPNFPPTPPHSPSTLPGWSGAAPLWEKSRLLDGDSACQSDFYVPELREFFTPCESAMTNAASVGSSDKPESSIQPVGEGTPVTGSRASILPSSAKTTPCSPAASTPGTGQLSVSSQALRDLMDLAEDGMTLTQYGYTAKDNANESGFIQEESEEQGDLCASGFLPESAHTHAEESHSQTMTAADQSKGSHQSVALSRLASDLTSMVNNPQLSDVQLQVDSGEVFFAHSFMMYARCPLLAEMVHESGFGVQEEGMPSAQRVMISDVPAQAVFTLLQFLYTAHCSIPALLQPHLLELAERFGLQELQQICQLQLEESAALGGEGDYVNREENIGDQTDQAFVELLRSMWNEDDVDDDDDGADSHRGRNEGLEEDHQADEVTSGDREIREEQVNEEELEEIYEFAFTQRKKEKDSEEEEEGVDEEEDGEAAFTKLTEMKRCLSDKKLQPNFQHEPDPSLDRSYSRLFSDSWGVYEEAEPSSLASTSGLPKMHPSQQSSHKPSYKRSGRALLQSSASVVSDPSISPSPGTSNLPVPGLSPGQVGDLGGSGDNGKVAVELEMPLALKRESQGPHSICGRHSPDSPQKKEEPELIVLSDSSEEIEADVAILNSCTPLPLSPSYTEIKSSHNPIPNEPALKNKEASSMELSAGDPLDCSPEVSWLIPSTPVRPGSSTRSSSTQTRSSMRRTKLFHRGETSPPSPFFSPLAFKSTLHPSSSQIKDSSHTEQRKGSISRLKMDRNFSFSPKSDKSDGSSKEGEGFKVPPSQPKLSNLSSSTQLDSLQASSKHDTPLKLQPQPYSSTPLQTVLHQAPVLLASSLLHTDPNKQKPTNQRRERAPLDSPEKSELGSFHLSPLSDPSGPRSLSSHGLQSSQRHSMFSNQSQRSLKSSISKSRNEKEGRELDSDNKEMFNEGLSEEAKGESREADVEESSIQQSFMAMDEPPLAFSDSWGLDACADADPGCFSLRLEDSEQRESNQSLTNQPESSRQSVRSLNSRGGVTTPSPPKCLQAHESPSITAPLPKPKLLNTPEIDNGLLDSKIWDSWQEEGEEEHLPLSQRVNPSNQLKTPVLSHNKRQHTLVPITPMPHYSDMDTPELKNKLNRFGVRPLPKRQMVLKLKEIHHYTHQLVSSDTEDEAPFTGGTAQMKAPASRPVSCAQTVRFREPRAPTDVSPVKHNRDEEAEPLSNSQDSNTSSTAASEESERSNPELCILSDGDSDSDGGISASQAASRLQDRLRAVRSFILSDSKLYSQILQYKPLVLSQLQEQLKAAGIRLGAAKLADYLDSQCITFTTAKPGHSAPSRRRVKRTGKGGKSR
ncbi:structure-specific endonuclease subunit SLX4 [Archocentrus centrarchus]|uniref:structure-specific endonuclease subunit SLX4 n=1 Tax=Archocentrus centrarchus TaxID=63155 RepID=UPI0011E9E487|nr:structure-specific endonuclease subunit SLX4 [Archocentrus centrarchus]